MNSFLNDNGDDLEAPRGSSDREITLGTTVVLGIFFALAVICAVFFGFGYSVGAKHNALTIAPSAAVPDTSATFSSFKPPSGSPAGGSTPAPKQHAPETVTIPKTPLLSVAPSPIEKEPVEAAVAQPTPKPLPRPTQAPVPVPQTPSPALPSAASQMMVQVAAVSHQEDADLLVSSLKRRNYAVAIHQDPRDKLLHVQVGPFVTRADADTMRQRLQADGFNAIVKEATH